MKRGFCMFFLMLFLFAENVEIIWGTTMEEIASEELETELEDFPEEEVSEIEEEDSENDVEESEIEESEVEDSETEEEDTSIPVVDIEIGDYEEELKVGDVLPLSATVLPADATNNTVTYRSSDETIATVNSSGEVKGVSKGNVVIYVTAESITKEVALTVIVETAGIMVNSDYLVLKPGKTFQLKATVTPADANQTVSYRSVDESVATVSSTGLVIAKKVGDTTIIISNGYSTIAVSVIVNRSTSYSSDDEEVQDESTEMVKEYADSIKASLLQKIDADTLYHLYTTGKILEIVGEGYSIEINGRNIVNYKNEFYTDIQLTQTKEGMTFYLNQGEYLCGEISLYIENPDGKYLYLYNTSKEKYEFIQLDNLKELHLTTPGRYLITCEKLRYSSITIVYFVAFGVVATLIGGGVYIGVKKKYWFW